MPSSGSTRSPPREGPVPLWLLVAHEDHPKACTGRRLLQRRLVLPISPERAPRRPPLLLDPHSPRPLGPADRPIALAGGVLGVDCSWNRLAERGGYPADAAWLARVRQRRRLPLLIATNPQHFGRVGELNTVEAFAATLVLLGEEPRARTFIDPFHGGPTFLEVNRERFIAYQRAQSTDELLAAESALFDRT
jgi:pre-rRNA-processing protein TSR3